MERKIIFSVIGQSAKEAFFNKKSLAIEAAAGLILQSPLAAFVAAAGIFGFRLLDNSSNPHLIDPAIIPQSPLLLEIRARNSQSAPQA